MTISIAPALYLTAPARFSKNYKLIYTFFHQAKMLLTMLLVTITRIDVQTPTLYANRAATCKRVCSWTGERFNNILVKNREEKRERLQLRVISQCVARASSTSGLCAAILKREEKSILLFMGS